MNSGKSKRQKKALRIALKETMSLELRELDEDMRQAIMKASGSYAITETAIKKVKRMEIEGVSEEQNDNLQELHRNVLRTAHRTNFFVAKKSFLRL